MDDAAKQNPPDNARMPGADPKIDTGGGAYIDGDVTITDGKFVGRDEIHIHIPPPPTPPSALFTLAAPPTDFVGREAELTALRASFSRGALITGVTGSGGIGKTALARVLASAVADRFPDARLELDLRGTTQPLTPAEAQRALLQPFYPGTPLPDDPAQLAGLYRQTFAQHAALLLLDNAANAAQVRPLLPPAPSAAIVTSRVRFSLGEAGLHPVPLGLLSPEESRELLRRAAPRLGPLPDATLDALAERCGRLPLALRAASALLAEREDWTADVLIAKLADERRRLRTLRAADDPDLDVEAVLGLSYATLEKSVQERFRMLGVFPAPFERGAACAVWACEDEEADAALGELLRRNLVDYRAATQDYALHDLTRCDAQARLLERAEEAREVVMRHAVYYLEQGSQADSLYKQGGEHVVEVLQRFSGLWPHLHAAWRRLSGGEAGWPRLEEADRWLSDFPERTVYVLNLTLPPRGWIPLQACALEAARRLGDRMDEGVHLGNLGLAYAALGEVRRAITYYEQQLAITREIGDRRGEGNALGNLGLAYAALGEVRRAIAYHEQSLTVKKKIGDRRGEGNALGNLGSAYYSLGEVRRAITYYEQQLEITCEIGDRRGEGNALGGLGNAYYSLGEVRRAIAYYEQWLEIACEIGDRRGEGTALGNLGNAYYGLGEVRRAIAYYEQWLEIAREIGDRCGEGNALGNLGNAYYGPGEVRRAIVYYEQQLEITREIGDRRGEGNALGNLGSAYYSLGEMRRAITYYEQRLGIAREIWDRHGEGNALANMGTAYQQLGDPDHARDLWQQALAIFEAIEDPRADSVHEWLEGLPPL